MTIDQAVERLKRFHCGGESLDDVYGLIGRENGIAYADDLRTTAIAYCTERPKLLAEIESLRKEKTNLEAFVKLQDNAIDNSDSLRAKADAFDWLVEKPRFLEPQKPGAEDNFYLVLEDRGESEKLLGNGTTPLKAVEDAQRRSEG